jgi:hypothetical protein
LIGVPPEKRKGERRKKKKRKASVNLQGKRKIGNFGKK